MHGTCLVKYTVYEGHVTHSSAPLPRGLGSAGASVPARMLPNASDIRWELPRYVAIFFFPNETCL